MAPPVHCALTLPGFGNVVDNQNADCSNVDQSIDLLAELRHIVRVVFLLAGVKVLHRVDNHERMDCPAQLQKFRVGNFRSIWGCEPSQYSYVRFVPQIAYKIAPQRNRRFAILAVQYQHWMFLYLSSYEHPTFADRVSEKIAHVRFERAEVARHHRTFALHHESGNDVFHSSFFEISER